MHGGSPAGRRPRGCLLLCNPPSELRETLAPVALELGLDCATVDTPEELRDALFDEDVALVALYIGRDMRAGEATCRSIRKHPSGANVPILAVIHQSITPQFPLGCSVDELLIEGFSPPEAMLRARMVLWRADVSLSQGVTKIGDVTVDVEAMRVRLNGAPVDLTYKEFGLLAYFLANPGTALQRGKILDAVWGDDYFGGDRTVDIHVRRLRAKLAPLARRIETVHGVGYRFDLGSE